MGTLLDAFRQKLMLQIRASHGIGAPYGEYEDEMMAAGLKPTMITSLKWASPNLINKVEAGEIIEVAHKSFNAVYRLYCAPEKIKTAQYIASLKQQTHTFVTPLSVEDVHMSDEFLRKSIALPEGIHGAHLPIDSYSPIGTHEEIERLLNGNISILPRPLRYNHAYAPNIELEEAVAQNKLVYAEFFSPDYVVILAQSDKVEDGKELAARYWGVGDVEKYAALSNEDELARIGQLLGYTKNDTDYFYRWASNKLSKEEQENYDQTMD